MSDEVRSTFVCCFLCVFNTSYAFKLLAGKALKMLNLFQTKTPFKHVYNYKKQKMDYYEVGVASQTSATASISDDGMRLTPEVL